jgi:hypothetical protein
MLIYTGVWGALALMLITFAFYRKMKARNEDDVLHVSGSNWAAADKQKSLAHSIEQIDRWGIVLTIVTVVYGVVLLAVYLMNVFQQGQKLVDF